MAKKIHLDNRAEPVLLSLIGISCHSRDYFLSFHLNKMLELGFVKLDDFREFPFFYCRDDNDFNAYYLVGNRSPELVLFPELKQTDYILLVEGPFKKAQKDKFLDAIRKIQHVLTAFEIKVETIKNIDYVLNELELHFMQINREAKITYSPTKR